MFPRIHRSAALLVIGALAIAPVPAAAQFEDAGVASFLAADANGDEYLTFDEFRVFIQNMAAAGAPLSIRIQRFGAYRIAFRQVDANGDGIATPAELRAADGGYEPSGR